MDSETLRNELLTSQWYGFSPGNIVYTGGNVGIGTNNPVATLQVGGTFTSNNPSWFITHSSGGNATYSSTSGNWFSSAANATYYGNSVVTGGSALASAWNSATGVFTFPVAGTYCIVVSMFDNGTTVGRYARASFGTTIKPLSQYMIFNAQTASTGNNINTWSYIKQVNAGDTFNIYSEGGTITLYLAETHSCINIFKIG